MDKHVSYARKCIRYHFIPNVLFVEEKILKKSKMHKAETNIYHTLSSEMSTSFRFFELNDEHLSKLLEHYQQFFFFFFQTLKKKVNKVLNHFVHLFLCFVVLNLFSMN